MGQQSDGWEQQIALRGVTSAGQESHGTCPHLSGRQKRRKIMMIKLQKKLIELAIIKLHKKDKSQ
jgi:hypothetical protein